MRWLAWIVLAACGDQNPGESIDAATDAVVDAPESSWSPPITISDPANGSFLPAIAVRGDRVVIAWHDFPAGGGASRVVTTTVIDGVAGAIVPIPEPLAGAKRPVIATTTAGFVLAWDVIDNGTNVIRSIALDADGAAVGAPVTISAAGVSGSVPRIAARGDDVVYAWTDGSAHFWARRGPVETVAAEGVGTTLASGGILNFPRIAVTSTGVVLIAYRDGGVDTIDWDVLLVIRQVAGTFMGPLNVSRSDQLLSDDISIVMEPDDTLDLVWVDQAPENVNNFEVTHATRDATGLISVPARFGAQNTMAWTPSAAGGSAAWHTGGAAGGDLWFGLDGAAPEQILAGEQGGMSALAQAGDEFHFVYVTVPNPRQLRYTRR